MTQHPHSCQWCPLGISGHQVQQACSNYLVQESPGDIKVKAPSPVICIPRGFSVPLFRPDQLQEDSHMGAGPKPLHWLELTSPACNAVLRETASHSHDIRAPRAGCRDRPFTSSAHTKGIILCLKDPNSWFSTRTKFRVCKLRTPLGPCRMERETRQPWTAWQWNQMQTSLYFRSRYFCIEALFTTAVYSVKSKLLRIQFFRLLLKTPPNRYINYL